MGRLKKALDDFIWLMFSISGRLLNFKNLVNVNPNYADQIKSLRALKRLKATTLVESMVAMTLIVVSFGIGMSIYLNVLSGSRIEQKTQAHALLINVLEDSRKTMAFKEETIEDSGMVVTKEFSPYPGFQNAYLLELKAFDGNSNFITEIKEVIYISASHN